MLPETYSSEDAQHILQIAIARQTDSGELTRVQLLEIADELNITPQDILAAEQEWKLRRGELQERQTFHLSRRQRFQQTLMKYFGVNAALLLLDVMTGGGLYWSLFVLVGWGVGIALEAWRTFETNTEAYEEAFQRWRRKRQLKRSVGALLDRWLKVS